MPLISMVGMPSKPIAWLARLSAGVPTILFLDGQEILSELDKSGCPLLILDQRIASPAAPALVKRTRNELVMSTLPATRCLKSEAARDMQVEIAIQPCEVPALVHPMHQKNFTWLADGHREVNLR